LLDSHGIEQAQIEIDKDELEANKNRILDTLNNYNIAIERITATVGPTVTLYEIVPQAGIRISKIKKP
jgi:DNA segregation ATPase FtsK/SpoIIIE and related proteins